MIWVKVTLEIGQKWHRAAPDKAVFTDQKLCRTPPSTGFEQAAVVPQIDGRLPHGVIRE